MQIRETKIIGGPDDKMTGLDVSFDPEQLTVEVSAGSIGDIFFDSAVFQAQPTSVNTSIFIRLTKTGEVHFEQIQEGEFDESEVDLPLLHTLAEIRFYSGVGQKDERDFIHIGRIV